jgi:DNA repair exonuclease SbcCD ATPase subunit
MNMLTSMFRLFRLFFNSYNEQLTRSLEKLQKDFQQNEEKLHEQQTLHGNEIRDFKMRVEQLEKDNEQLRHEDIVHVEPTASMDMQTVTLNTEECEQLHKEIEQLKQEHCHQQQQWTNELEEYKSKCHSLQVGFINE